MEGLGTNSTNAVPFTEPVHEITEAERIKAQRIFTLVLFTLVGAQLSLVWWKQAHQRSYDMVSLVGLWLVPGFIAVQFRSWHFLIMWTTFSFVTARIFYLCLRSAKIDPTTPRLVFTWFLWCHNTCMALSGAGGTLFFLEAMGIGPLVWMLFGKGMSVLLLFNGLYFGALVRDVAELAASGMATTMAFRNKLGINPRTCALCSLPLRDDSKLLPEDMPHEPSIQLHCGHSFHEFCIKGWTIVGKKDTCPACMEKVDLKALYADRPWESRNLQWTSLLDFMRYMVVWVPVILSSLHVILHILHMD